MFNTYDIDIHPTFATGMGIAVADLSRDAYSYHAYPHDEWQGLAIDLVRRGYTAEQVNNILRSKITRWARDAYSDNDEGRMAYVIKYLKEHPRALQGVI